jgi:hypothetical protein
VDGAPALVQSNEIGILVANAGQQDALIIQEQVCGACSGRNVGARADRLAMAVTTGRGKQPLPTRLCLPGTPRHTEAVGVEYRWGTVLLRLVLSVTWPVALHHHCRCCRRVQLTMEFTIPKGSENEYTIFFYNCKEKSKVSFHLDIELYNMINGKKSYLSGAEPYAFMSSLQHTAACSHSLHPSNCGFSSWLTSSCRFT